jgi:hypothetical protein
LLALDGILSAIFGALLLPSHIGRYPFPISAVISGALNAALVWAGLQCTSSVRVAAVSLWTWLLTMVVLAFGAPGGSEIFGGPGFDKYSPLLLLILGVLPPLAVLRRHRRPGPTQ